ncbi:MAG: phosphopantetheine adenylyltransferase [Candidatus Odinarchaeia archaeon]
MPKHKCVALGGTFDNLHEGHKFLIRKAFQLGEKVIFGLTSDEFCRGKILADKIQNFEVRRKNLLNYIKSLKGELKFEIVKLDDKYGPAIENSEIDAILVTKETLETAEEINLLRKQRNLKPIKIYVEKLILAEDGKEISSTRIRKGEITPEGKKLK